MKAPKERLYLPNGILRPPMVVKPLSCPPKLFAMQTKHIVLLLALHTTCTIAAAQWTWLDESGRKVFSDRAPPPHIPSHNVVAKPVGARAEPITAKENANPELARGQAGTPPLQAASVDPELEKRKAEQEALVARQKQEEENKLALQRKEQCDRAKRTRDLMQSGQMLSHTNAQGERGYMSTEVRQQELTRAHQAINSHCR